MRVLQDTNIDFMKYRKFWIIISLVLVLVGLGAVFIHGELNLGIDFAGGTQMNLRFLERPQLDELRSLLGQAGLEGIQIQRFGDEDNNEVLVKTRVLEGTEEGSRERIVTALNRRFNQGRQAGMPDLNQIGADALAGLLAAADPDRVMPPGVPVAQAPESARAHYLGIAEALLAERRKEGMFTSWDQAGRVGGVSPAAINALKQRTYLGEYAVLAVENVGPQIGKELSRQGFLAVVMSLLGMLVYIWFRFELRFGIGAVMASLHDVLVTLGLFTLLGRTFNLEFNLTTIAAFLTLIGYSVNDTVVIFDRIRENMRKNRRKPLIEVMNESINQTLSRTIMTSGLTFLTVLALLVLGGDVLRGFSFVMTVGIIVGTYSSIYIASPFALLWEQYFGATAKQRKLEAAKGGAGRPAAPSPAAPKPTQPETQTPPRPARPAAGQRSRAARR